MSTIKTTNITHGSNTGTSNLVLDNSGNVTIAGNTTIGGNTTTSGNISPTGDLIVASGKGLDFSATAGPTNSTGTATTSEKLLDYEEGTWTPALGSENGGGSITYSIQDGHYVKVGKLVNCFFYVQINAVNTACNAGTAIVTGLPYTVKDTNSSYGGGGVINWYNSTNMNNATPALQCVKNQTYAFIKWTGYGYAYNAGVFDGANHSSSDTYTGTIIYIAA